MALTNQELYKIIARRKAIQKAVAQKQAKEEAQATPVAEAPVAVAEPEVEETQIDPADIQTPADADKYYEQQGYPEITVWRVNIWENNEVTPWTYGYDEDQLADEAIDAAGYFVMTTDDDNGRPVIFMAWEPLPAELKAQLQANVEAYKA